MKRFIKIKNIGTRLSILMLIVLFSACKKLVSIGVPSDQLVTTGVFANNSTAIAAQLSVYANYFNDHLGNFERPCALLSDELTYYSTQQPDLSLYQNNLVAQSNATQLNWTAFYQYIYRENAILENLQQSTGVSTTVRQYTIGEAKFMRAYLYFLLVNQYGGLPLVTGTDYTINNFLVRSAPDQVYQQIVSDLLDAQKLLSDQYTDASDNTGIADRVRPTTWAATALLARVYLYIGKFDLAEQQANLVINNTAKFSLVTDLTKVFKANSAEAIWQLLPPTGINYTNDGNSFILTAPPATANGGRSAISTQLLAAFEPNDNRRTAWVNSFTQSGTTWYYPYKYHDNATASSLSEYEMVFRLAEQYLIRAEARAQLGENNATDDLNKIRNRAGLPNYSGPTDKASLMNAIMHERQVELFTEGHRWFDLKRTKTIDAVMTNVTPLKGGSWNTNQQLYPIPADDLLFDKNLVQNPGY